MLDWYFRGSDRGGSGAGDDLIGRQGSGAGGAGGPQGIPLNIFENEDGLVLSAPMPGIEESDLDISVLGDELRLRASERGPGQERKDYLLREWSYGPYERRVRLPYAVDADRAVATLGNGVLVLTLPRAASTRPRKIALTSG